MVDPAQTQDSVRVATLNVRNTADRWKERRSLVVEQLVDLQPDVIGIQELRRFPKQGKWILDQVNQMIPGNKPHYSIYISYKTGLYRLREGIGLMSRLPVINRDRLNLLGGNRVAQRIEVKLPSGGVLEVYNTHFHHAENANDIRSIQARMILAWMAQRHAIPKVLVGDFNDVPDSATINILYGHLRPTFQEFHGAEPAGTVPTQLREDNRHEEPKVIDYIFINEHLEICNATTSFDQSSESDATLVPSDHIGLVADLKLR